MFLPIYLQRWDNEVAKFAGDWIEWCTSDNHGGKFGENVFSSSSLPPDAEFIQHTIASWYGEETGISNNGEDCGSSCNYTQVEDTSSSPQYKHRNSFEIF